MALADNPIEPAFVRFRTIADIAKKKSDNGCETVYGAK